MHQGYSSRAFTDSLILHSYYSSLGLWEDYPIPACTWQRWRARLWSSKHAFYSNQWQGRGIYVRVIAARILFLRFFLCKQTKSPHVKMIHLDFKGVKTVFILMLLERRESAGQLLRCLPRGENCYLCEAL